MEIRPKKSLGQNFLTDRQALDDIIAAAGLSPTDKVIEIGPGTGVLTEKLVEKAGQVIAVEKDRELANRLEKFRQVAAESKGKKVADKLRIIADDILKVNLPQLIDQQDFQPYKLVANIPYYITGQIIRLFLETKYRPSLMVLLVQKEVAERICALPGQMSVLAVSVQYYGTPTLLRVVPRTSFNPVPEVDSAIVKIILDQPGEPESKQAKHFFRLVKIGFVSKRKTLLNNLAAGLKKEKKEIEQMLVQVGLNTNVRAQELSINDWERLVNLIR